MAYKVESYLAPEGDPDERCLVYVGAHEFPWYIQFTEQANTDTIATFADHDDRWVIQKINGAYEVYATQSIKQMKFMQGHTIGAPKFVHEDFNSALMWALMNL